MLRPKRKWLGHVGPFATPWTAACQASLSSGTLQARILEWVVISFSRESSQPRNQTQVSCLAGRFFTIWVTREARGTRTKYETKSRCWSDYPFLTWLTSKMLKVTDVNRLRKSCMFCEDIRNMLRLFPSSDVHPTYLNEHQKKWQRRGIQKDKTPILNIFWNTSSVKVQTCLDESVIWVFISLWKHDPYTENTFFF